VSHRVGGQSNHFQHNQPTLSLSFPSWTFDSDECHGFLRTLVTLCVLLVAKIRAG
jgi:hypothetical protein